MCGAMTLSGGRVTVDDFWNTQVLDRAPRALVPADMAVDALLDARCQPGIQENPDALDAVDELLARISHRQRLTPDEAIVVVFQLNAAERQFGRAAAPVTDRRRRRFASVGAS